MKEYKRISTTIFKDRFGNHKKAFNNNSYKVDTELSKEDEKIIWKIYRHYPSYTPKSERCSLCQNEKLEIAFHIEDYLLKTSVAKLSRNVDIEISTN